MKQEGVGDLYAEYEKLKAKLEKEGLFEQSHKQKIPMYPRTIGVLTSQTGSVIRDIINVSTRRNPNVNICLFPVPVQGKGAEIKIAEAIKTMNEKNLADVIIVARGGGSLEDLWPFNEEITARAIYNSKIPVISAVGHETDFSISDFVADLRAPTPSAAAELAVPDVLELKTKIITYQNRYKTALLNKIKYMRMRYEKNMISRVFTDPLKFVNEDYQEIDSKIKRLIIAINDKVNKTKLATSEVISTLDALSPLKTLTRGYCLVTSDGKVIKRAETISTGEKISLKFIDGEKNAQII